MYSTVYGGKQIGIFSVFYGGESEQKQQKTSSAAASVCDVTSIRPVLRRKC